MKQSSWSLTAEALNQFLLCLDSETEKAGEKYEEIRLKLVKFFGWRGAYFPEECADETLNRVIRKIGDGATIDEIPSYCLGVARLVFLEFLKSKDAQRTDFEAVPSRLMVAPQNEEPDDHQPCFQDCLAKLPEESRQLILQYYADETKTSLSRQTLAEGLAIPIAAVRSRAQRIRDKLEKCIHGCVEKIA